MSGLPARGYLGISEVLAHLRADFPDISVSKIRFLETEGLISPARSPAGYRRFSPLDVDRLRYILAAQRDEYLPLRVIKERLDRLDQAAATTAGPRAARVRSGQDASSVHAGPVSTRPGGSPAGTGAPSGAAALGGPHAAAGLHGGGRADPRQPRLTRRELLDAVGLTEALLTELETFGLLRRIGRSYGADAIEVASAAAALTDYGVEARHLRAVRAAAERESTMIESLVAPVQRQRGPGARAVASRTAQELAGLVLRLHRALVDGALAEAGLDGPSEGASAVSGAPLGPAEGEAAERGVAATASRSARGFEGASA